MKGGEVWLPEGCKMLGASNLRGTGYVARDFSWQPLAGRLPDGTEAQVNVRFAGLQGYLMAKSFAARFRGEPKDYYDLVYVLIHNREGGPAKTARLLRTGKFGDDIERNWSVFEEISARFHGPSDYAAIAYAEQALAVDPGQDRKRLAQDAITAVTDFTAELRGAGE